MRPEEVPRYGLNQMDLLELGNTIQVAGVIYANSEICYLAMLPDEPWDGRQPRLLELDQEDWEKVIRQTDIMETEVLTRAKDGTLVKAIIRKSTRQIEQGISWKVYSRDGYHCRYCGTGHGVPLTVDHLVLWEEGGPSIPENLVACCRRCNKTRGQMKYADWLRSPYYLKVSQMLMPAERDANERLVETLGDIPLRVHEKSR